MEEWFVGDNAECVKDDWPVRPPDLDLEPPRVGQRFIVAEVTYAEVWCDVHNCFHSHEGLRFVGMPGWFWVSSYFKKIRPDFEERKVPRREEVPA